MTFGMTLAKHLTMAASANMFYFAIDYEIKLNMKVAASNETLKYISCFLNSCPRVSAWPLHSGKPQGYLTLADSSITCRLYLW